MAPAPSPTRTTNSTTNYNYDKSGNMIQSGSDTYSWDYQNKMTDSASNGTTNHYLYDTNGDRVQKDEKVGSNATTTTKYWSKEYETFKKQDFSGLVFLYSH
ncbi:MAG: hypothetical protein NT098_03965 [Candidatus Parcubacteria bacterium]|nr:hypothetical protein [Candidatus Parcubacteria bacterium]